MHKIVSRHFLLVPIALFLIFLVFSLGLSYRQRNVSSPVGNVGLEADIQIAPFSFVQTGVGGQKLEITARRAEFSKKSHTALLQQVNVMIRTARGLEIRFKGDEGGMDTVSKNFYLKNRAGLMEIALNNGYVVKTERVEWLHEKGVLMANGLPHIYGPHMDIKGQEARVVLDEERVTVSGDVKTSLY